MRSINIYLNKEERKKCEDLKYKYKLSLTTIADIIGSITLMIFEMTNQKERIVEKYIYQNEKGTKTSIKEPKAIKLDNLGYKNLSRIYTNAIKIYIKHDIDKFIDDPKLRNNYWNSINKRLTTTTDEFYDYNRFLRYQRRNLRENKEYYKHEIDKMENR